MSSASRKRSKSGPSRITKRKGDARKSLSDVSDRVTQQNFLKKSKAKDEDNSDSTTPSQQNRPLHLETSRDSAPTVRLRSRSTASDNRSDNRTTRETLTANTPNTLNTPPLTSTPVAPSQKPQYSAALRLDLGNAVFFRLSNLPIQIEGLENKPGIQGFLSQTLVTDAAEAELTQFLPTLANTVAMDFPAASLNYLYAHRAELKNNPGLQEFLITALQNDAEQTRLNRLLAEIQGTPATGFSTPQMNFLYQQMVEWSGQPGLKSFLVTTLATKGDETELERFLTDIQDPATANFSAQKLTYLYSHREDLSSKPALKEFLIATLVVQADETGLDLFLAEIKDTPAMAFSAQQLADLYRHRDKLPGKSALKEFLIATLATQGNNTELELFLREIENTLESDFSVSQLDCLYELRADLNQRAISQLASALSTSSAAKSKLQYSETTVLGMAIAKLTSQLTVGSVKAEMATLRDFGYNERLYALVQQKATDLGKKALQKELNDLNTQIDQQLAVIEQHLKDRQAPGSQPLPASGTKSKDIRKANDAKRAWESKTNAYNDFVKKTLPGLLSTERQQLQQAFAPQRAVLTDNEQAGVYAGPELKKFQQFVATNGFHEDTEWAIATTDGNLVQAQMLFDACQGNAMMKKFGQWSLEQKFNDSQLQQLLTLAAPLNLDIDKTKLLVPYLLECTEQATKTWLATQAGQVSLTDLTTYIKLLGKHKPATQALLIQAIGLNLTEAELNQYNFYLLHPTVGQKLLTLIQNRTAPAAPQNQDIDTPKVMAFFKTYASKLDNLAKFLNATDPRPTGYNTLEPLCNLVKPPTNDLDSVVWAIGEAQEQGQGKAYIEHVLKRLMEGQQKNQISDKNIGYKEWLLVSGKPWGTVTITTSPYKSGPKYAWTGIFKLKIDGNDIEIHNHFIQDPTKSGRGQQFSLHIKHGSGSFDRGPDLEPKKDVSVYQTISQNCQTAYTNWVNRKPSPWTIYTLPT
jgi:hypothetical protein